MDPHDPAIETAYSLEQHAEGESRRLGAPLHLVEPLREAEELRRLEPSAGHLAKTLVKLPDLRVVLISFKAGARLMEHRADGPITVQTLAGLVRIQLDGERIELPVGRLLVLARAIPHDLEAVRDSEVLLTIAARPSWSEQRSH